MRGRPDGPGPERERLPDPRKGLIFMEEKNEEQALAASAGTSPSVAAEAGTTVPFSFLTEKSHDHRENLKKLFPKMSASDYMLMWLVAGKMQVNGTEKVYLVDIAESLNLPIHRVSSIVKELKSKGLVVWKHDGDGDKGTYIQLTENSLQAIREQHDILQDYYHKIIDRYGEDNFIQLLGELSRLEEIMSDTLEEEEDEKEAIEDAAAED